MNPVEYLHQIVQGLGEYFSPSANAQQNLLPPKGQVFIPGSNGATQDRWNVLPRMYPNQQKETPVNSGSLQQTLAPIPSASPSPNSDLLARNPSLSHYLISPQVQNAIGQAASQYSVPKSLLGDIILQESSFNPSLINTTPEGVQAGNPTGLGQFTDSTWNNILGSYNDKPGMSLHLPNTDRKDPLTSALALAYLVKFGQLGRWDASKDVWGKFYNNEELSPYYSQTLGR